MAWKWRLEEEHSTKSKTRDGTGSGPTPFHGSERNLGKEVRPRMTSRVTLIGWVVLCLFGLVFSSTAHAFYLPGVAPQDYERVS